MGCTKRTKNGDLIWWPCGNKDDGHMFGSSKLSGREGYKKLREKRKEQKAQEKIWDKESKNQPGQGVKTSFSKKAR